MLKVNRKAERGMHIIHLMALVLISLMISSVAIDFGYYFAAQNQLQTVADAASLAATTELYESNASSADERQLDSEAVAEDLVSENHADLGLDDGDVQFGYIDPETKLYDSDTFSQPSNDPDYAFTGGYNAALVNVRRMEGSGNGPISTIMANMVGVGQMDTAAQSIALMDQTVVSITDGGVRPIYACEAQFRKAMEDGILENNAIRVYGDRMEVDGVGNIPGCPAPGSGNWGFADLRDCDPGAPGANDTASWFKSGFQGKVTAGECRSTQSGNFIVNNDVKAELDNLIANKTVITIPLYDTYSGGGSNTTVGVSAFAGFVITGYTANGSANQRNIQGYFTKTICKGKCETGNDGPGPGGAVVKLRLAAKS